MTGASGTSPAAAAASSACTRSAVGGCVRSTRPSRPKNPGPPPALLAAAAAEMEESESAPPEIIACAIRPAATPLARRSAGARAAAASIWRGMVHGLGLDYDWILQYMPERLQPLLCMRSCSPMHDGECSPMHVVLTLRSAEMSASAP